MSYFAKDQLTSQPQEQVPPQVNQNVDAQNLELTESPTKAPEQGPAQSKPKAKVSKIAKTRAKAKAKAQAKAKAKAEAEAKAKAKAEAAAKAKANNQSRKKNDLVDHSEFSDDEIVKKIKEYKSTLVEFGYKLQLIQSADKTFYLVAQNINDNINIIKDTKWRCSGGTQTKFLNRILDNLELVCPSNNDDGTHDKSISKELVVISDNIKHLLACLRGAFKALKHQDSPKHHKPSKENLEINLNGIIGHTRPLDYEDRKKIEVPIGLNNPHVKVDSSSRNKDGGYTVKVGDKTYTDVGTHNILSPNLINDIFSQHVTACNIHRFNPVDLVHAMFSSVLSGFRDDRPLTIKSITDRCDTKTKARNLREWLSKSQFTDFFVAYGSLVIQISYFENRHQVRKSNDAYTKQLAELLDKVGLDDLIAQDGVLVSVSSQADLTHDFNGNGSKLNGNKSEGDCKYNSSGHNSHSKHNLALSILTRAILYSVIREGTCSEPANVDAKAIASLGRTAVIMDRAYRSILNLMRLKFHGVHFIAREQTTCSFKIYQVFDKDGNPMNHLNLIGKSVTSPEVQDAVKEHGVLDVIVDAVRYVYINTITEDIDHLIDPPTKEVQSQRRACMGATRMVLVHRGWKSHDDCELIRDCLEAKELDTSSNDLPSLDTEEVIIEESLRNNSEILKESAIAEQEVSYAVPNDIMYLTTSFSKEQVSPLNIRKLYLLRWIIEIFAKVDKQNFSLERCNAREPLSIINCQIASLTVAALNSYLINKAGAKITPEEAAGNIEHMLTHHVAANLNITRRFYDFHSMFSALRMLKNGISPGKPYNITALYSEADIAELPKDQVGLKLYLYKENFVPLQQSTDPDLAILELSDEKLTQVLNGALIGQESSMQMLKAFDQAMHRLHYDKINSAQVIQEIVDKCNKYKLNITLALQKPKTPTQISMLSASNLGYMGNLLDNLRSIDYSNDSHFKSEVSRLYDEAANTIVEKGCATHITLSAYEKFKDYRLLLSSMLFNWDRPTYSASNMPKRPSANEAVGTTIT